MTIPETLRTFVDGRCVDSGRLFDKVSPVDGALLARVHEADRAVTDRIEARFAAVWTQNLERGHRVAAAMRVGMSWVNTWYLRSPFGGAGRSGIGREGGAHSLRFYTEPTNVCVQL